MRRICWISLLLALLLTGISYAAWAQNELTCTTCPTDGSTSVPYDIAVNVVFNQDIDLLPGDAITISGAGHTEIIDDPVVKQYTLWLWDPWKSAVPGGGFPPDTVIQVHIPAARVAAKDGTHPAKDIDFSFTTGSEEKHFLTNFVTQVSSGSPGGGGPTNPGNTDNPPVAVDDQYRINKGETSIVNSGEGIFQNDYDTDKDVFYAELVSPPQHGKLELNTQDGSFQYTPDSTFSHEDIFKYIDIEEEASKVVSNEATVTITANTPPEAKDDNYTITTGQTLTIGKPGVLANDTDADGDSLKAILVSNPSNGHLTQNSDGSFTYVPNNGFTGSDTYTYKANDGYDDSNPVTVAITVKPVNNGDESTTGDGDGGLPSSGGKTAEPVNIPQTNPAEPNSVSNGSGSSAPSAQNLTPSAIPPAATPKMPNTGADPVDHYGPWTIAAGIYLITLFLVLFRKRRELFACRR